MRSLIELFPNPSLMADEGEGCRYILGDTDSVWTYCCEPKKRGMSYCSHHHSICYLNDEQADYEKRKVTILARSKVGVETSHMILG